MSYLTDDYLGFKSECRWDFLLDIEDLQDWINDVSCVPSCTFSHVCTHKRLQNLPPCLLSCLAPVSIDTDGGGRMRYKERQKQRRWLSPWVYIRSVPPSLGSYIFPIQHLPHTYIYPSATHPSIPPLPRLPQFIIPTLIYPSMLYVDS